MSIRLSQRQYINIPHETTKSSYYSNRDKTFITSCLKELKSKNQTICFKEWHIEELQKHYDNLIVEYSEIEKCYFVKIKD